MFDFARSYDFETKQLLAGVVNRLGTSANVVRLDPPKSLLDYRPPTRQSVKDEVAELRALMGAKIGFTGPGAKKS